MGDRKSLRWMALLAALLAWGGAASAAEPLHLIYTADVRGTVGICG